MVCPRASVCYGHGVFSGCLILLSLVHGVRLVAGSDREGAGNLFLFVSSLSTPTGFAVPNL